MSAINVSRRRFLKTTGIAGGSLVVGFSLSGCSDSRIPFTPTGGSLAPNAFVEITPENGYRFICPREEMGQGVSTGLTTLVAEDLDVAPQSITIEFAGAHSAYNNPEMGVQATGGSNSLKAHYHQLRQVGADTRALVLAAAAKDLGVDVSSLSTADGHVITNGERYPYGAFVATARTLTAPENTALKPTTEFRYIGQHFPRLDGIDKATGTAEFAIDVEVPGMHYAQIKRSPVAGAELVSLNADDALAMPGVTDVVPISDGVAVVAEKFWQAKQALNALSVEWSRPPLADISQAQLRNDYQAALDAEEGDTAVEEGDVTAALADASATIEAEYWAPHLAHAPMEPMSAVLKLENGAAELWAGTQGPGAAQGLVARYSGLDKDTVTVHTPYLGGGFGRRGTLTHIREITETAVATGKSIHLLWTREDDIQNGLYRPASLMRVRAGADAEGTISAWDAKRVGGNITPDTLTNMLPGLLPTSVPEGMTNWVANRARGAMDGWVVDPSSIEGLHEDYDTANRLVTHATLDHGLPLTFWRSVGHSYTAFAIESAVDELAHASGKDVIDFRLENTRNNPRLHNVIQIAGERMRAMDVPSGHGLGIAAHTSFNSAVAEVADVSVENGRIRVHKVLCVVDCGLAVNPDVVRAQMEGGIVFGLTAALHGNLQLENGAIRESNFHDYPLLRMNESPEIEVVIVESDDDPTGVGEPGTPPIAPAVANAVFAATGQRLRELPLRPA